MKKISNLVLLCLLAFIGVANTFAITEGEVVVSGEQKQWHKVTLSCGGVNTSETNGTNPFLNYRLQVTFTKEAYLTTFRAILQPMAMQPIRVLHQVTYGELTSALLKPELGITLFLSEMVRM